MYICYSVHMSDKIVKVWDFKFLIQPVYVNHAEDGSTRFHTQNKWRNGCSSSSQQHGDQFLRETVGKATSGPTTSFLPYIRMYGS